MHKSFSNIFLALFLFVVGAALPATAQVKKPNIVFILADDLGYGDLGCYGSAYIQTPHIDALAKSGMQFENFYAGSTVCAPSRATLMTGKHTGHAYIRGNGEVPLRSTDTIIPQLIRHVGYRNGMVGKWGLGQAHTDGSPEKKGWDFFSGHQHHVEGHYQLPDSAWQIKNGATRKMKIPNGDFANKWFTDEAKRFISESKSQPFFLYVSYTLPHAELVVPEEFLTTYLDNQGQSKFLPEKAQRSGLHYGAQQYPKAAYAAMITQMDSYVGELLAHLKREGLDENTIVIFTSDNGTHAEGGRTKDDVRFFNSSGPFRGMKRDLYEGGIRVPFIVRWSNKIKPGSKSNHEAAFWDVLPTVCALAGVENFNAHDGISMVPTLLSQPQKKHPYLYWEFYEGGFKQAVKMNQWKAIRLYSGGKPIRTELFDLSIDIGEMIDVSDKNYAIVKQLEAIMEKEHVQAEHPSFSVAK